VVVIRRMLSRSTLDMRERDVASTPKAAYSQGHEPCADGGPSSCPGGLDAHDLLFPRSMVPVRSP